jgi:hypothetical protein
MSAQPLSLLVFELDGASWTIIEPLLKEDRLPHMADLICRGASGVLHSERPLISPALWTTIYTGQPREKHGVQAFDATAPEVRYRRLWDVAYAHGMICGVCGSLVTWPPYDVGGFMIPDIMARDATTIPPQVASLQELTLKYPRSGKSRFGPATYARFAAGLWRAGVSFQTMLALAGEVLGASLLRRPYRTVYWRRALLLQQLYTDVFVGLHRAHRPRLATYHYHAVDTLSHRYWPGYAAPENSQDYEKVIPAAYQAADRALGRLMAAAGPDATVLLLSDHGFLTSPEERSWYTARLTRWIDALGLKGAATPTRLGRQHILYFREPARVEEVGEVLRAVTFKETGAPVLPKVITRDTFLHFLPPIVRGEGLTVVIPGRAALPFEALFDDTGHIETGVHHPEGIAVLAGPAVRPGIRLEETTILDVTPTALALLGLPVARDMPGRVWTEAIQAGFLERFPVSFVDSYSREMEEAEKRQDSDADIATLYQRLQDLGYL